MAWEERSGRQYYYSKSRQGERVISQYLGAGELGRLAAMLDQARQFERAAERAERRRQIEADSGYALDTAQDRPRPGNRPEVSEQERQEARAFLEEFRQALSACV